MVEGAHNLRSAPIPFFIFLVEYKCYVSRETHRMILYKNFAALPNFVRRHHHS